MSDIAHPADPLLEMCPNDHCQRLAEYLQSNDMPAEELSYEDVFTPLRCHYKDGLALELSGPAGDRRYVWGAGDFIYPADCDARGMSASVDPFDLWGRITQDPFETFTVVIFNE